MALLWREAVPASSLARWGPKHHYLSLCGQNEVRVPEHMHPRTAAVNSTAQRATVASREVAHALHTVDNGIVLTSPE